MKVWMICEKVSGALISIAHDEDGKVDKKQVVTDPLPDHLEVHNRTTIPNFETHQWDPGTRRMRKKPERVLTRREVLAQKDTASLTDLG